MSTTSHLLPQHHIVLIGCGKMGGAMLEGWIADTELDAHFSIIEPFQDHLGWTTKHAHIALFESCAAAESASIPPATIIVLAVKPQMMDAAIGHFAPMIDGDTAFLSIAAGITTAWLASRLDALTGGTAPILRAMPNTPAAIGHGITVLYSGKAADTKRDLAAQLLAAVGQVVMIDDESLMDAVTAVSGSGPAYVFLLAEVMTKAAIEAGLPADLAAELAEATVAGAGALIAASDDDPSILRANVTSKGGTTAAALDVLMADDGMAPLLARAIAAAKARSIALGS
ncbi:pyrroline-5-carboxylate reductase [Candidatus Puniceispirillum marinum]|nr:pyrroline-5-carboxylate reductase [Candidatus Puniceispirillum marinum]